MKGIYISADKMAALLEWAENARREAEALLAETRADNQAERNTPYLARTRFKPVVCGGIIPERLKNAEDGSDR
jgi:hypothetical protein